MAVNAVTRNTKRILILNEELNEQRGMINALLNPRSYTLASADLSTSESQLLSLNAGGYALYGFLRLQADNSTANNTVSVSFKDSQANILGACVRQLPNMGIQTLDIPFCIYPAKGQVDLNASAMAACSITGGQIFLLGI